MTLPRSWDAGDNQSSHSIGSHGADDASIREYRQGDDLRKVHWRSTAKTGALMVRHEERPWQGHTCVLLDVRAVAHTASTPAADDPRQSSSLEWAVSFAASVVDHLLRAGRDTTLVAGTAVIRPNGPHDTAVEDQLTVLQTSHDRDLVPTAEAARSAGRESAVVAVARRPGRRVDRRPWPLFARGARDRPRTPSCWTPPPGFGTDRSSPRR